jgi:hypothetical protein
VNTRNVLTTTTTTETTTTTTVIMRDLNLILAQYCNQDAAHTITEGLIFISVFGLPEKSSSP